MKRKPYCRPLEAGIPSETAQVCKRIGRLLTAMDVEINCCIVEGGILDDIAAMRTKLVAKLRKQGWTMSYDGGERLKVREPGHKRPYGAHA